jgi:hypothetical protein
VCPKKHAAHTAERPGDDATLSRIHAKKSQKNYLIDRNRKLMCPACARIVEFCNTRFCRLPSNTLAFSTPNADHRNASARTSNTHKHVVRATVH